MRCVSVAADGHVLATAEDGDACMATEYVLVSPGELDSLLASPFRLSLAEGAMVAAAVLGVWVSAYAIKAAARALSSGDPGESSS